jgi:hypothetical protein
VVRVSELLNLMIVTETHEEECEFKLLYYDDIKGSVPTWLTNWAVSKAVPAFLAALVDANKKKKKKEQSK